MTMRFPSPKIRQELALLTAITVLCSGAAMATRGLSPSQTSNPHPSQHVAKAAVKPVAKKAAPAAKTTSKAAKPATIHYAPVQIRQLLQTPEQYMGRSIEFDGTFTSFHTFPLDYKKAFRDSKDYIAFLIKRPDVANYTIPLSELKLIYPRKKAEAVMHLESGDEIRIQGTVFNTALHEPWVDVNNVVITKKLNPEPDKKASAETKSEHSDKDSGDKH